MKNSSVSQIRQVYYKDFIQNKIHNFQNGFNSNRNFKDPFYLAIFVFILTVYLVLSTLFISIGSDSIPQLNYAFSNISQNSCIKIFLQHLKTIMEMVGLSVLLSLLILFFFSKFPNLVVLISILATCFLELAIIVLGFVWKIYQLSFIFTLLTILSILFLWRNQDKIVKGLGLVQFSSNFMKERKDSILIGIISFALNLALVIIFVLGWVCANGLTSQKYNNNENSRQFFGLLIPLYYFSGGFFAFFLYFFMTFVVATAVGNYYFRPQASFCNGYKLVTKQIGSLTIASLSIILTTIIKLLSGSYKISQQCKTNPFYIFFKQIYEYSEVMNHNSIIVMQITSQNYKDSVKSTLGIINNYFGLFSTVDSISNLIYFHLVSFCIGLPSIIAAIQTYDNKAHQPGVQSLIVFVMIFIISWTLNSGLLGIIVEVNSSLFMFSSFNKQLDRHQIVIKKDTFEEQSRLPNKIIQANNQGKNIQVKVNEVKAQEIMFDQLTSSTSLTKSQLKDDNYLKNNNQLKDVKNINGGSFVDRLKEKRSKRLLGPNYKQKMIQKKQKFQNDNA